MDERWMQYLKPKPKQDPVVIDDPPDNPERDAELDRILAGYFEAPERTGRPLAPKPVGG